MTLSPRNYLDASTSYPRAFAPWRSLGLAALLALAFGASGCVNDLQESTCGGRCGAGTVCDAGKCVVAASEGETTEVADKTAKKGKQRGKRRLPAKDDENPGAGPEAGDLAQELPPLVSDHGIPGFTAKPEVIEMAGPGNEPLSDAQIEETLKKLDGAFQTCVMDSQKRAGSERITGTVALEFGLAQDGKVTGINARGANDAKQWGLHACLRRRLFDQRFPKFRGADMTVTTSVAVD